MLNIDYIDEIFIIRGTSEFISMILQGRHRVYFSFQLGGHVAINNEGWNIPSGDDRNRRFNEITSYLQSFSIPFHLNEGAQRLESQIQEQVAIYTQARERSLNIKNTTTDLEFPVPNFQDRELKNHQIISANHLLTAVNGANFSVPGSGKTTVVYAVYDNLKSKDEVDGMLVIGPPSCFMPWTEEYESCFGTSGSIVRLAGRNPTQRREIYEEHNSYEIFLTTYQTASNDIDQIINLSRQRRLMTVLDESHYIKKIEGGVYADAVLRIAPNSVRRVILTGTPMPNSTDDLWTQITFLWPNQMVLGNVQDFSNRRDNIDSIREDINPFFIRIGKEALDLPEQNFNYETIPMSRYQSQVYHSIAVNTLAELELAPDEIHSLRRWRRAKMVRLLQAASNPTLLAQFSDEFRIPPISYNDASIVDIINHYPDYEIPSKIQRAIEITNNLLDENRKILIWTWFVHNITMLQHELSDHNPLFIHGGVPRNGNINNEFNREEIIRMFLTSDDNNILIANPSACAESISLHSSCHDAIYLDRTFNCGQYLQSLDRIHRIGLDHDQETNYYILIAENSIDEIVRERLLEKETRMRNVIDEDLPVLSMDIESDDPSDDENIDEDFDHVVENLREFVEDD